MRTSDSSLARWDLQLRRLTLLWAALLFGALSPLAQAADSWTEVAPGVDWLHRVTSGSTPQDIHVVQVDLSRPEISIQASQSSSDQSWVATSTFAQSIGATVAVNGDWNHNGSDPIGVAIGNGVQWSEHFSDSSIGGSWGYFACDAFSQCEAVTLAPLTEAWWFASPAPTLQPYRYFNAVGANGILLIDDGVRQSGCYDGCDGDVCRHPRTAICTSADQQTLTLFVADGRRSDASGMTCGEMRDLAEEFNCWDAAMLDGGGSSTMYIDGAVRNEPSDGSQRSRPNHIGIVVHDGVDSECQVSSGRWCEGSVISTCSGGRHLGSGDCAYYGASCEEDGDWAYCVNLYCPDGEGQGSRCLDEVQLESCNDGVYSSGDCSVFGTVCGEDSQGAQCMDSRCSAGPHSSFCIDQGTLASCEEGSYTEQSCPADQPCVTLSAESAVCQGDEPGSGDSGAGSSSGSDSGDGHSVDSGPEVWTPPTAGGDSGAADDSDLAEGAESSCGCQSSAVSASLQGLWMLLAWGLLRRRR